MYIILTDLRLLFSWSALSKLVCFELIVFSLTSSTVQAAAVCSDSILMSLLWML